MTELVQCRQAANTFLPLDPANAIFVPLAIVPVTIERAGAILDCKGQYVASCRAGSVDGYVGFGSTYFSAVGLVMTATDPTGQATVPPDGLIWFAPQDGGDAWPDGNPYCRHDQAADYETSAADIGQRWIMVLGWATSDATQPGDQIATVYAYLDVLQYPGPKPAAAPAAA